MRIYFESIVLTWYFDKIFRFGVMPADFNISLITPIPKNNRQTIDPSEFRPISVSTTLSMIFEDIIGQNIILICANQFGFKSLTSTKHAYFVVNETLQHYRDGKSRCWAVALDATKAFDRRWRKELFFKLIDKVPDII